MFSPCVFTLNRKVQVSYVGAALCSESKQCCLFSLTSDDEWTDGVTRRSVISTLIYPPPLTGRGKKGGG